MSLLQALIAFFIASLPYIRALTNSCIYNQCVFPNLDITNNADFLYIADPYDYDLSNPIEAQEIISTLSLGVIHK